MFDYNPQFKNEKVGHSEMRSYSYEVTELAFVHRACAISYNILLPFCV